MVFITAVAVLLVDIVQIDNIAIKSLDTVLVGVCLGTINSTELTAIQYVTPGSNY